MYDLNVPPEATHKPTQPIVFSDLTSVIYLTFISKHLVLRGMSDTAITV